MNTVINSYNGDNGIRYYELSILSERDLGFFLPLSYEVIPENKCCENIRDIACNSVYICSDISEAEPVGRIDDGGEAPYMAADMIYGMEKAMFNYILPWQYEVRGDLIYFNRHMNIRLLYEPRKEKGSGHEIPGKEMRLKTSALIKEVFSDCSTLKEIMEAVIDVLESDNISFETCKRRIEKLKEEAFFLKSDNRFEALDPLDLYEKII